MSFPSANCHGANYLVAHWSPQKMPTVQSWVKTTTHLKRDVPIFINNGVWERIMLHTGISGSDLFSQGAVHIPTRLRMKPTLPIVSVVTWGYLKSLQTNRWQMRWNSWFMKIWTLAWLHEKSTNAKLGWAWVKLWRFNTWIHITLHCHSWPTVTYEPNENGCGGSCLGAVQFFVLSQTSSPTLSPLNRDGRPVPGCSWASTGQGSL